MPTLAEGSRLGSYCIVRLLGEGGMGAVYEARQEPLGRRVAIKTLHPQFAENPDAVARFFNEARVLSRLEHPSLVQVSDFWRDQDGSAYLVMEYLRGQSLRSRLKEGRLAVMPALQLGLQVADVLATAHAQGVVHRDIKPDNLMLVADPVAVSGERVKVLDFGIAKLLRDPEKSGTKTKTAAVMGTPAYMAPEQCAGAGGVNERADVYSLGCVLYEAIAGRPPFVAEGAGELIGMHLFTEPARLDTLVPALPRGVVELVHRMLTKQKSHRPDMSAVAMQIGTLLSELSGGMAPVRLPSAPPAVLPGMGVDLSAAELSTRPAQLIGPRPFRWRAGLLLAVSTVGALVIAYALIPLSRAPSSVRDPGPPTRSRVPEGAAAGDQKPAEAPRPPAREGEAAPLVPQPPSSALTGEVAPTPRAGHPLPKPNGSVGTRTPSAASPAAPTPIRPRPQAPVAPKPRDTLPKGYRDPFKPQN